jgi:predicted Zn-ribbon and HTH transcriptional regulator
MPLLKKKSTMIPTSEKIERLKRPRLEIADIFQKHAAEYKRNHPMPLSHLKVIHAISVCRTKELGGHIEKCDRCGFELQSYNSCRNRHCPKCQALTKAVWLEKRKKELLPVDYFHNVFTLPHEINPLTLVNKKSLYTILFQAVAQTLTAFGEDGKYGLGGKIGFIGILHTWDQKLLDHFHLHCLIPGGCLSFDKLKWISTREDFLFDVRELSKTFREKFIYFLERAYKSNELLFPGSIAHLVDNGEFGRLLEELWSKDWVVYSKESFVDPEYVLDYLGRYTHRVAISNNRLVSLEDDTVTFTYKDRKDEGRIKPAVLSADEFIRRFLLHVLPDNFVRIRYFGFLANRYRSENLRLCRKLLGARPPDLQPEPKPIEQLMLELCGLDISLCPLCGKGKMRIVEVILPASYFKKTSPNLKHQFYDTS